jgi:cytochrome c oxidase assembly protein subunit 15
MWIDIILTALLVACVPLSLVWVSNDANKYRKLVFVTLFLTFDLIMFGGFTRLTDSGLGCPDWPGCYGEANPFISHAAISVAEAAMPQGPVTHFKAWVEMIHRYLAATVGVLIFAQMLIAWIKRKQFQGAPGYATALLFFVCLQGAFGAWTVTMKLQPIIVTTHLLLGMGLLAMLAWLAARIQATYPQHPSSVAAPIRVAHAALNLKWWARVAWVILVIQIALGGWVSTNYAVLACTDYPLCQGVLVPQMDFDQGFTLWRELGKTAQGEYLSFAALTAIHWVHRNFAWLVILSSGYVAMRARQIDGVNSIANAILAVLFMQFCTGLANIVLNWPLPIAVLHNGGAALLLGLLTVLNYRVQIPIDHRIKSRR